MRPTPNRPNHPRVAQEKYGKDFEELSGKERQSVGGTIGGNIRKVGAGTGQQRTPYRASSCSSVLLGAGVLCPSSCGAPCAPAARPPLRTLAPMPLCMPRHTRHWLVFVHMLTDVPRPALPPCARVPQDELGTEGYSEMGKKGGEVRGAGVRIACSQPVREGGSGPSTPAPWHSILGSVTSIL